MKNNEIQAEINALKILLAQTDYKALKLAEAVAYGEDISQYSDVMRNRQLWRDRINELEKEVEENAD